MRPAGDRRARWVCSYGHAETDRSRTNKPPGTLRSPGESWGWEFATLSFPCSDIGRTAVKAGCRIPDAIRCGKQRYRSHSRTVPALAVRNLSGEAS